MSLPDVLRKLLTAPGPSGYEQAAAAVFRDAAAAFAEVTHDSVGSYRRAREGDRRRPAARGHRPHRRDRPDRPPHRRRGLPLVQRRRRLGPDDPRRPARGDRHARRHRAGVVGKKPIHLLRDEERKQVPELRHLHIDIGAADGDDARAKVRIGDVAVITGEPLEYPNGRVVSRSMDNRLGCFVAFEVARLVAEAGGAPGDVAGVAVTQEEITFAGARTTAFSLQPDVAIVVDVTFATDAPGSDEKELGKHKFGSGPVIGRGSTLDPQVFELLHAAGEEAGIPFTVAGLVALHGHRRRRRPHLARRHPDRRRLDPAALHALAGRDGPARRRREHGEADRGVRAEAQRRPLVPPLSPPLFSCSGTSTARCCCGPRASTRRRCAGPPARSTASSSTASRSRRRAGPTRRSPATCCAPPGVGDAAIDARAARVAAAAVAAYAELCPPDLSAFVAPGVPEALEALAGDAGDLPAGARHRQPRGDRAAQARQRRDRPLLPARPGRLRLRRRGPRGAARRRARPRRRLGARADGGDRRHAARHRLRARRPRPRDRGRHRAVRAPRRWPTRTPSSTASAPRCRCWPTGRWPPTG